MTYASRPNRPAPNLTVEMVPINDFKLPERLVRGYTEHKLVSLAQSIDRYDFLKPILIDKDGVIVDGIARFLAAKRAGRVELPAIRVTHLSPKGLRALRVALAKTTEGSHWLDTLAEELVELCGSGFGADDFCVAAGELDQLLLNAGAESANEHEADDPALLTPPIEPVSRPRDIWLAGACRFANGDSFDAQLMQALTRGESCAAAFADFPYGVSMKSIGGRGRHKHKDFAMGAGEQSPEEFQAFNERALRVIHHHLRPGGLAYVCMNWLNLHRTTLAAAAAGFEHKNTIVWVKPQGGLGGLYRSRHEMIPLFEKPGGAGTNNVRLGKYGRNRSNVWEFPGNSSFGRDRDANLAAHPTVKPTALVRGALLDCTVRGDVVLDTFAGSGTLALAAQACGRAGLLCEIDPAFVDVALARFHHAFGIEAVHEATGLSFSEVARRRRSGEDVGTPTKPDRPRGRKSNAAEVAR